MHVPSNTTESKTTRLKALIVDDSALMRRFHKNTLEQAGFVTELASDGQECLNKLTSFAPDVIVLDINMPVMDGLTCLKEIMRQRPTPVVMVSSLTTKGAQASFDALALGAVDYIQKPSGSYSSNMGELSGLMVEKLIAAANVKPDMLVTISAQRARADKRDAPSPVRSEQTNIKHFDLVVIGVSTGGPNCLQTILPSLSADYPCPIVIAQHMPARFTSVFAQRLDTLCALKVIEVTEKQEAKKGNVYIAQGDGDILVQRLGSKLFVIPTPNDKKYVWHPSVSKLVDSALQSVNPSKLCCVQLTGMGNDGAQEMYNAFTLGATTIAESSETSVVFGMPGQLVKKNGATHVAPNYLIASLLS